MMIASAPPYARGRLDHRCALAGTHVLARRDEEARSEAAEVTRIDPQFSLERYARTIPFRQPLVDELVKAWRKAGLK